MRKNSCTPHLLIVKTLITGSALIATSSAWARDIEYKNTEVPIYVTPGEPTQIQFPGVIQGGFKKKQSAISLDRKNSDLIVFAQESLEDTGEAIIVRLDDGRTFSVRIKRSAAESPRDDIVKITDPTSSVVAMNQEEEEPAYKEKNFEYAPTNQVSGFMREMILAGEFGKALVPGYRASDKHKGELVLNDGAIKATVDRIFVGSNLWGYILEVENLIDQTQKLNPASFRLDGTRAVSAEAWELAPRPLDVEQQVSNKHKTRVYIITRAKK